MSLSAGSNVGVYKIIKTIVKKSEYYIYEAENELSRKFLAAEFYPEGICQRDDEGFVIPLEGYEEEFSVRLNKFKQSVSQMKSLSSSNLARIFKTEREDRNNCFCFFHQSESSPLVEYLGKNSGKLNYKQAFDLIQPLSEALERAAGYGIYFYTDVDSLYVNAFGNMENTGFLAFDYNINYIVEDLANVYYTMVTGGEYKKLLTKPSAAGAQLPETLDNLIYDTLFANTEYRTIGEFISKIKDSVLFDNKMAFTASQSNNNFNIAPAPKADAEPVMPVTEPVLHTPAPKENAHEAVYIPPQDTYVPPMPSDIRGNYTSPKQKNEAVYYSNSAPKKPAGGGGKILAGCFIGGCFTLIAAIVVIVVVSFAVVDKYGDGASSIGIIGGADGPSAIATAIPVPATPLAENDYEDYEYSLFEDAYVYVSYYNNEIAFNSTVCAVEDYIYYRCYADEQWFLARSHMDSLDEFEIIIKNVFPSFLTQSNDILYYVDAFKDNSIFAIDLSDGENLQSKRIYNDSSAYLTAYEDTLYFVNLLDGASLNSYNIKTGKTAKINGLPCDNLNISEDKLVYIVYSSAFDDYSVSAYDFSSGKEETLALGTLNYLKVYDENIYFLGEDFNIGYLDENGDQVYYTGNLAASYLDIARDKIYYIDFESYGIMETDISGGRGEPIGIDTVYFQIIDDYIFYYDYVDEYLYYYDLETGDSALMYEGHPNYYDVAGL